MQAIGKVNENYILTANGESNSVFGHLSLEVVLAIFESLGRLDRINVAKVCLSWNSAVRRCAPLPTVHSTTLSLLPLSLIADKLITKISPIFKHCSPRWYCINSGGSHTVVRSLKEAKVTPCSDSTRYTGCQEDTLFFDVSWEKRIFMVHRPEWVNPLEIELEKIPPSDDDAKGSDIFCIIPLAKDQCMTITDCGNMCMWQIDIEKVSILKIAQMKLPFKGLLYMHELFKTDSLIGLWIALEKNENPLLIWNFKNNSFYPFRLPDKLPGSSHSIFSEEGNLAYVIFDEASQSFHLKLFLLVSNKENSQLSYKLKWCKSLSHEPSLKILNNRWLHYTYCLDKLYHVEEENIFFDVNKGTIIYSAPRVFWGSDTPGRANIIKLAEDYVLEWFTGEEEMKLNYLPLGLIRTFKFSFEGKPPQGRISDIFISPKSALILPLFDIYCSYWLKDESTSALWAFEVI